MEVNRVRQIIGVMRIAPETQDFCEVGNLVKKKLERLKTARLVLIRDSACGPEWTSTHLCTIHWRAVIAQLGMNLNWVNIWLVCAPCIMHRWNKNPTLSQNPYLPTYRPTYLSNFLPTYVLLFLPLRLLLPTFSFPAFSLPTLPTFSLFLSKTTSYFSKTTTYLPTDPPTYRISYLPMCFFSYLSGSCTYFLISCFLTTHLTYLLNISLLLSLIQTDLKWKLSIATVRPA